MHVRIALSAALIVACSSTPAPPPARTDWSEDDTIAVIRRDWEGCRAAASEETCLMRARTLAVLLPPTREPLTPCGAQCNSNLFCDSGIIRTCRVCGFGGTCTTSIPQRPSPDPPP